ncbi:MAG TPA: gamma-glutamyltransferase [Methylomirabilota bacterium]|nr:gamma-glutamyltransferase [Methylomirabilota bacterium]
MKSGRALRLGALVALGLMAGLLLAFGVEAVGMRRESIQGSSTYRAEVAGRHGVVTAGRNFATQAGLQVLSRGGTAVDAGVAAVFAAAVTEISHFGLGGEVPIVLYHAGRREVVVINGQGWAPAGATRDFFRARGGIPANGPSAGAIPAVVDALAMTLAEYGTLSLGDVLAPAIALADGFPWYDILALHLGRNLEQMIWESAERVYVPGGQVPKVGALFRQENLARTLRALVEEEARHRARGRKDAIYAARDRFYRGDIAQRIAKAVQDEGGLMTAADLASYRGRVETPTRGALRTPLGTFEVLKTDFWGQGPVLLQALALLEGVDLVRIGHNSPEYIHTVTEALKLALADRDAFYGDPDAAKVPRGGLLSPAYAAERRKLIDPAAANNTQRPGDPWRFEPGAPRQGRGPLRAPRVAAAHSIWPSPDTTTINAADAAGNLFSASPSSAWFTGGTFIAGDTGVPLGNRMQAFVLDDGHPNVVAPRKRPRTTLTPTVILRDGKPWLAFSSPGGDSQDQQALQLILNLAVFGMRPQAAIEAPRFNSLQYVESFGQHRFVAGVLEVEDRIPEPVRQALERRGHVLRVVGPFGVDSGTALAGHDAAHGTVFGAADVRRQRFVEAY